MFTRKIFSDIHRVQTHNFSVLRCSNVVVHFGVAWVTGHCQSIASQGRVFAESQLKYVYFVHRQMGTPATTGPKSPLHLNTTAYTGPLLRSGPVKVQEEK